MRKKLIAANWKMNNGIFETEKFIKSFSVNSDENIDILICAPFISLHILKNEFENRNLILGAQNVSSEDKGAYTGEISANMLKELEVSYVIAGHSERRNLFFENDDFINKKLKKIFENDMTPILCCGETSNEKAQNKSNKIVENQILKGIDGIAENKISKLVIAYEPVWAIGSGKLPTNEEIENMALFIRNLFSKKFSKEVAENIRILYGGSVKAGNIKEILENENIDGALIGGASVNAQDLTQIVLNIR